MNDMTVPEIKINEKKRDKQFSKAITHQDKICETLDQVSSLLWVLCCAKDHDDAIEQLNKVLWLAATTVDTARAKQSKQYDLFNKIISSYQIESIQDKPK